MSGRISGCIEKWLLYQEASLFKKGFFLSKKYKKIFWVQNVLMFLHVFFRKIVDPKKRRDVIFWQSVTLGACRCIWWDEFSYYKEGWSLDKIFFLFIDIYTSLVKCFLNTFQPVWPFGWTTNFTVSFWINSFDWWLRI